MRARLAIVATVALLALPAAARAQAWTPPARSGSISVSFQSLEHTGHLLTDGTYIDNGRSRTGAVYADVEYGVTTRLALAFSVPYVWARYTDDDPPPPFLPFLPVDQCRCWHSDWQDYGFMARFKLVDTFDHVVVLTPLIAVGTPTHDYPYQGESVVGRNMNEVRIGADGSYRLDALSHNLSLNGRYTYAFVERVIDVGTNRSNANVAADYRIGRDWSVGGFVAWQRTHGGLRIGAPGTSLEPPGEVNTDERIAQHDRLLRDNFMHVGAQASYRLWRATLFGIFTYTVAGTDSHQVIGATGGVSVPFNLHR
jgi:hypothetical protein